MIEAVFSVDLSSTPAHAVLAQQTEGGLQIIDQAHLDLGWLTSGANELLDSQQRFSELCAQATDAYARTLLIAPVPSLLSLTVSVPPTAKKERSLAIRGYIEDILPFDQSEFIFDEQVIHTSSSDGQQQVHVSGFPHMYVRALLENCAAAGFNPEVICPPSSALAGALLLEQVPSYDSLLFLLPTQVGLYQLVTHQGKPLYERLVPGIDPCDGQAISREAALTRKACEARFQCAISKVFSLSDRPIIPVPGIDIELLPDLLPSSGLAHLAAGALTHTESPLLLSNLRVQEFKVSPTLDQLKRLLPRVIGSITLLFVVALAYAITLYSLREARIKAMHSAMAEQITRVAPHLTPTEGQEVQTLKDENERLTKQLRDLSSALVVSPLDALAVVFKDIPTGTNLSLQSLELRGQALILDGTAPDYKSVEDLEHTFRVHKTKAGKEVYCRIKKEIKPSSTTADKRPFRFELRVCNTD